MKVEVSNGELLDKLSILELKLMHIKDRNKIVNINKEISELKPLADSLFKKYKLEIKNYYRELSEINSKLWKIEDDIRECERKKDYGKGFIELARSVYFTNDKRSAIKKAINILTHSGIIEEKSYEDY